MDYAWMPMETAVNVLGYELCWGRADRVPRSITLQPSPPNLIIPTGSYGGYLVLCRVEQSVETGLIRRIPVKDIELPVADE